MNKYLLAGKTLLPCIITIDLNGLLIGTPGFCRNLYSFFRVVCFRGLFSSFSNLFFANPLNILWITFVCVCLVLQAYVFSSIPCPLPSLTFYNDFFTLARLLLFMQLNTSILFWLLCQGIYCVTLRWFVLYSCPFSVLQYNQTRKLNKNPFSTPTDLFPIVSQGKKASAFQSLHRLLVLTAYGSFFYKPEQLICPFFQPNSYFSTVATFIMLP